MVGSPYRVRRPCGVPRTANMFSLTARRKSVRDARACRTCISGMAAFPIHEYVMRRKLLRFPKGFSVVLGNGRSQAATMVLAPGDCEGSSGNRHRGADQWLYVQSGKGVAIVDGARHPLQRGTMLLVERGQNHEIRNTGRTPLKTVNLYVPPAYRAGGDELPRGRS